MRFVVLAVGLMQRTVLDLLDKGVAQDAKACERGALLVSSEPRAEDLDGAYWMDSDFGL